MNRYPTKKLKRSNYKITLPFIIFLVLTSANETVGAALILGPCLILSSYIIPAFCEKYQLLQQKKSMVKVALISLICALPWLLNYSVKLLLEEPHEITIVEMQFVTGIFLLCLKDFIITLFNLPKESCEPSKKHVPYWLLVPIPLLMYWLVPGLWPTPHETRLNILESVSVAKTAQLASADFYLKNGRFPKDNTEAGLTDPREITGGVIRGVYVKTNSTITLIYTQKIGNYAHLVLQAKESNGEIMWECAKSRQVITTYLPEDCRAHLRDQKERGFALIARYC